MVESSKKVVYSAVYNQLMVVSSNLVVYTQLCTAAAAVQVFKVREKIVYNSAHKEYTSVDHKTEMIKPHSTCLLLLHFCLRQVYMMTMDSAVEKCCCLCGDTV